MILPQGALNLPKSLRLWKLPWSLLSNSKRELKLSEQTWPSVLTAGSYSQEPVKDLTINDTKFVFNCESAGVDVKQSYSFKPRNEGLSSSMWIFTAVLVLPSSTQISHGTTMLHWQPEHLFPLFPEKISIPNNKIINLMIRHNMPDL